jgi:hypothetical protein
VVVLVVILYLGSREMEEDSWKNLEQALYFILQKLTVTALRCYK